MLNSLQQHPVRRRRRRLTGWLFVAPYVVSLIAFGVVPVIFAIVISTIVTPVVGPSYFSLTQNFADVLTDYRLPTAATNVVTYLLIWLPLLLLVVFTLALVMDAKRNRFAALTRFVTYVPGAVTGSAATILWIFMFSPAFSPVGPFLRLFSDGDGQIISNESLPILLSILAIAIGAGGWVVLVFGALTAIPSDLLDAARIDGVSAWQLVWFVKLPLIRSYTALILIISFAGGFQVFVEPAVMAAASSRVSTMWSVNQVVFSYISTDNNYGRASALALVLLALCTLLAVFVIKRTNFYRIGED